MASSSLDSTICIWRRGLDEVWAVHSRLGQFIGNRNAYFDVLSDPGNTILVALNFTGAVLLWKYVDSKFILGESFNGHSNDVKSI